MKSGRRAVRKIALLPGAKHHLVSCSSTGDDAESIPGRLQAEGPREALCSPFRNIADQLAHGLLLHPDRNYASAGGLGTFSIFIPDAVIAEPNNKQSKKGPVLAYKSKI